MAKRVAWNIFNGKTFHLLLRQREPHLWDRRVFPFATTDFAPETQKTAFAPPRIFIFNTPPFPLGYNIGLENSRTDNSTCCRGCTWYFNRDFRFRFRFRFRSLCDPLKKKERGGGKNSTVSSRLLSPARSFITPFLFHHGFFSSVFITLFAPLSFLPSREISRSLDAFF